MRPVEVDTDRMAQVSAVALRVRDGVDDASADLLAARCDATGVTAAPDVRASLEQGAARRERALQHLGSLALVVRLAAQTYEATERSVDQAMARLLPGVGPVAPGPGWSTAVPGWSAAFENLLDLLDPAALEALLVASPSLATVVSTMAPEPDTPAAGLAAALKKATLLRPAAAAALVGSFLAAVPAPARRRLALLHPHLMVTAVAAPPEDRYAASRVLVSADLGAQRARLLRQPDGRERRLTERRIAWEEQLLHGTVELRHPDGTVSRRPHQLLSFDPSGDGQIVEVLGDLRRAEHVGVFVPGTGSDLVRYPGTFSRMLPFAAADPTLAVVVWQGADHPDQPFDDPLPVLPQVARAEVSPAWEALHLAGYAREHVLGAALRESADVAGPALARDVEGLRAAVPGPTSDLTVVGHSYGGSIVGAAELNGMTATRVVHVAGAGAYVQDVSEYPASAATTRRFSMTAFDDPIQIAQGHDSEDVARVLRSSAPQPLRRLGRALQWSQEQPASPWLGHGADPDLLRGVVRLDTGVHQDGSLVRGHSGMFAPGSTAWRNLLAVMTRGEVEVLEPDRWSSHLDPGRPPLPGLEDGGVDVRPGRLPRFVIDRTPYEDPDYRPPRLDLSAGGRPG